MVKIKKGRVGWIPALLWTEAEDIKREDNINSDSQAMRELVKYARVGREAKRLITLDWSRCIRLPKFDMFPSPGAPPKHKPKEPKKQKKSRGLHNDDFFIGGGII